MATFTLYTYQFAPIQIIERNLFDSSPLYNEEDRMNKKQNIFAKILLSNNLVFRYRNKIFGHKIISNDSNIIILKIANTKNLILEQNFHSEKIEYTPSCYVIVDNRHEVQHLAIENDKKAFSDTDLVSKIIQNTLNKNLKNYGLSFKIQKNYKKSEFWDIVNEHPNQIELIRFHFLYPNLPRVNKTVKELIAATSKATNSKSSTIELKAGEGESLILSEDNNDLQDLAQYSADSGDKINIKIRNNPKFIQTGNHSVYINIDTLNLNYINSDLWGCFKEKLIETLNKLIIK